uniref:Uncharacterized protein n=1 Tax=Rhizophora mucronata TaxID=61149 RepID=A0A2P2QKX4_RHIMU
MTTIPNNCIHSSKSHSNRHLEHSIPQYNHMRVQEDSYKITY